MSARTPLHALHEELGGRMVPFAGWRMPIAYGSQLAEHAAVRQHAGLFDVSHMAVLDLEGPKAPEALNPLIPRELTQLAEGRALYTLLLNPSGGCVDDLLIYRRAGDAGLRLIVNAANREAVLAHLKTHGIQPKSHPESVLLALQGPEALRLLEGLGLSEAPRPFRFAEAQQIGTHRCDMLARTGYTGEDGVECFFTDAQAGEAFARALLAAGAQAAGLAARDTLRLEAGLPLYGHELDAETTPLEAGLARFIDLEGTDFVGREALRAGTARKQRIGLRLAPRSMAREGYAVHDPISGEAIGTVSSGSLSPTLGYPIAMAYVPANWSGTELEVDIRGRRAAALRVPLPFYTRPAASADGAASDTRKAVSG